MQIVTGRRGEPHVTSRQMQAVYRSFLGDFALLDIGEKLRAEAYSNDIVRVYDGVVSVQGIYAVIAYNQYDEVYIEPVSVGKKRIDTIVLHYTKDNTLDVEDMQLDVVQGEEYTDNPIAPVVPEGGDAWEGTTDIQVPIYDVEVTNFGLTVIPHARMLTVIPTLDSIAERIPETVVTGVKGDSEVLYRDGDVNITKANIGLGNVDNTADTDKPISTATQTALNGKVDKVAGKGLSTEDYTTTDKTKLAGISEGATQTIANPADTATETLSKLEVGGVVYDVPQGASGATELSELTDVNLTDVEDNNILQYDETANKWKNSNALQGSKTATGNPLTIEDAAPVNAVNLSMDLEPKQDLHGYDHPWVGGAGKNKLPMTVEGIKAANTSGTWSGNAYTLYGVTFTLLTDSDGNLIGIKLGGTSSADNVKLRIATNVVLSAETILNGITGGTATTYRIDVTKTGSTDFLADGSKTLSANTYTFDINIRLASVQLNTTLYPMVRLSTETDSSFAPYTNICPISGRSEVAIQRVGKNLFGGIDFAEAFSNSVGYTLDTTNKVFTFRRSDIGDLIIYDQFKPNTRYTLFISAYANLGANRNSSLRVEYTDGTIYYFDINTTTKSLYTYTTTSGKSVKRLYLSSFLDSTVYAYYDECGVFEGVLTVDDFEPYAGKTYTIQIGQTVYGGQLDVTRGKMVVDRGYAEFDGSSDENWGKYSSGSASAYAMQTTLSNLIAVSDDDKKVKIIANELESVAYNGAWGEYDAFVCKSNTTETSGLVTGVRSITTVADWKTYLASNPLQVVYELATPFTIDLTPQQIKMLENTNTLSSDGNMALEYQPNNAIGEAVRVVEESYDPEFAVRPVLKKKAFNGTTDSDGAVTLISASDIPSNHRIIPLQITDMTIGGSAGTYFVEYKPYNSGDSVKGYCYTYFNGSQITPVGSAVTGIFYYYELEV